MIRHAPIRFYEAEPSFYRFIKSEVNEGSSDAAMFVFWSNRNRTDVECLVERSTPRFEWKGETLRDAFTKVLNHVVMNFVVFESFE